MKNKIDWKVERSVNWYLEDSKILFTIIVATVILVSSFSVPDDFKVNPGPVEDIAQHPSKPEKVNSPLIIY